MKAEGKEKKWKQFMIECINEIRNWCNPTGNE